MRHSRVSFCYAFLHRSWLNSTNAERAVLKLGLQGSSPVKLRYFRYGEGMAEVRGPDSLSKFLYFPSSEWGRVLLYCLLLVRAPTVPSSGSVLHVTNPRAPAKNG